MFKNVEPLTKDKHQDLRFSRVHGFSFAKENSSAPITAFEFVQAGKYYPIVFLKDNNQPVALLSLEKESNRFLTDDGLWTVPYVPAHFRRYPFILALAEKDTAKRDAQNEQKYVMCIDIDAPHFENSQGDLLFTANGDLTDLPLNALEFLKRYQQEITVTASLVKVLAEKEILVDKQFNLEINGKSLSIEGFRAVDIEKMNKLEDSVLAEWVRTGVMAAIIAHVQSLELVANLK